MFDRRLVTHFDGVLLLSVCLAAAVGVFNLYSATWAWEAAPPIYLKQLYWLGIGMAVALLVCAFDYRHLEYLGTPFYVVTIGMLLAVLLFGKTSMGATRWLNLGLFNLQPSEVMKVVIIVALARYFSRRATTPNALGALVWPFSLMAIPVALIMKQPDLGTAMLILFIGGTMMLFAGIRRGTMAVLSVAGLAACWVGWAFILRPYQKERVLTFLNPESDPLDSGYHIIQSKIAVGSGGLFGKGFMDGTQAQLSFLPERHTDFAFSVFAEEWGFVGCMLLLLLYLFIIIWGLYIARRAGDSFGMYLAVGVVAMFFWHTVVNLGMVIGLLPVVGVPLPLFSYGGTSMVTTMVGVGILLNVSMRRFMF
jgi:rod shape determining protein RodA